jgi:GNAT superfamily N-acetyltransferase
VLTRIRRGDPIRDAERIRELAEASKAHWGYDPELVREWADALDFTPGSPRWAELYVAESDGKIVGWVGLLRGGASCVLDDLWIDPAWIRRGIGARLFRFAARRARELGAERMEWGADPNAVGFYERMGGHELGEQTGGWGRPIPHMAIELMGEGSFRVSAPAEPTAGSATGPRTRTRSSAPRGTP